MMLMMTFDAFCFRFHEVISIAFAASTWVACYAAQPSVRLAKPFGGTRVATALGPTFTKTLRMAAAQTAKLTTKIPALRAANAERLTLGLAESLMFRGAIKPITFGGKLYLSYKFVMWTKERKKGKTASASMAMATKTTHRRQRGRREKAPVLVSA